MSHPPPIPLLRKIVNFSNPYFPNKYNIEADYISQSWIHFIQAISSTAM
jgi:hypothetical protein